MSNDYGANLTRRGVSATVIVLAVVALMTLVTAIVIAVVYSPRGFDDTTTPIISTLMGFVTTTVVSLVALLRIEQTRAELKNGLIPAKLAEAVEQGVVHGSLRDDRSHKRTRASDKEGNSDG